MRRMLFLDIDGTLVNSRDRTIPDSAGRAIRLARAAGHLVYVNSGRPWCGVDPRVKAMGFHGFVCGCGLYLREGDEILFRQRLAKDVQQWAVDLVRRYRLQVMYEGADHVYFDLTRPLAPQVAAEKAYYDRMGLDTEGDPAGPEADFDKFVVWTGPGFDLDAFRREVEPGFDLILREGCLIELVSRGCSKGKAMEALMARHGMDRADCVAIGDSTNDLPMLETAGVSVAMGNGDPRIFDRVSFVTAPVEQDGIAKALERLGLI